MFSASAAHFAIDPLPGAMLGIDGPGFDEANARVRPADLDRHRAMLTRYARRCLRNLADVEDAVQDTLTAALTSTQFAGRSSLGTWLHGILRHKIIDIYRRQAREPVLASPTEDELHDETETLFTPDGHWREPPTPWGDPEAVRAQREFVDVLDGCLACLPPNCARAFRMRELMGLEVAEICDVLGISSDNCHVMLHRARMKLRVLLQQRWFAPQP
jgi:RNA polymerase sigma-70 factor, ECF subfamily